MWMTRFCGYGFQSLNLNFGPKSQTRMSDCQIVDYFLEGSLLVIGKMST